MGYPLLNFTNGWIMIIFTRNRLVRKNVRKEYSSTWAGSFMKQYITIPIVSSYDP